MNKWVMIFNRIIFPIIIVVVCFMINIFIGLLALFALVLYWVYQNRATIYANLGNIQYTKGKTAKSMKWLDRAYHTPNCPAKYSNAYGYLLLKSGDIEQAEKVFNHLLSKRLSRSDEMSVRLNLAMVIWKQGNLSEATDQVSVIFADYKNSLVYSVLGYFLILKEDLEAALLFNLEAYEYNDTNHVIMDNLGQTYYLLGDDQKAIAVYEKLIPLSPTFPEAYYNYGLVLLRKGDKEKALAYMQKSLTYSFTLLSTVTQEEIQNTINHTEKGE